MRPLTSDEIAKLAGRAGVRHVAVENYLSSLTGDRRADEANLYSDAASYRWNAATVAAIQRGIQRAYEVVA